MNAAERAAKLCQRAEKQGMDAPSEFMISEAITDALADSEQDFLGWLMQSKHPEMADLYMRDLELKGLEDAIR